MHSQLGSHVASQIDVHIAWNIAIFLPSHVVQAVCVDTA